MHEPTQLDLFSQQASLDVPLKMEVNYGSTSRCPNCKQNLLVLPASYYQIELPLAVQQPVGYNDLIDPFSVSYQRSPVRLTAREQDRQMVGLCAPTLQSESHSDQDSTEAYSPPKPIQFPLVTLVPLVVLVALLTLLAVSW